MAFRHRVLTAICDNRHQIPLIVKLLVVMAVLLGFSFFFLGLEALNHPIIVVDLVIIGGSLLFFSVALRYCEPD